MTKRQEYVQLEKGGSGYQAKIEELRATVSREEHRQSVSEAEALRAEVLNESGWKKKREEADHIRDLLAAARTELARAENAAKLLSEQLGNVRPLVQAEILAEARPKYASLLQAFYDSLKTAAAAESLLEELAEATDAAGRPFGCYNVRSALTPAGKPNITLVGPRGEGFLAEFKQRAQLNDYELKG